MKVVLVNPTRKQVVKALSDAVAEANGNMRTRTVSDQQVADWAKDVTGTKSGRHSIHGGHVANAYRYPATAAAVYCYWAKDAQGRKHVLICGHQVSARKGSGIGHPLTQPTRDKLEAEGRMIECVYPHLYVSAPDVKGSPEEERPFLRAIANTPKDAGVRLVYADWLQERDRPADHLLNRESDAERAEFVRSIYAARVACVGA
jgi:uncharacterized protein (TIGR02996 family)